MEAQPPKTPKIPISIAMIVRNCKEATLNCLRSLEPFWGHPEDELVVIDTGSQDTTPEALENLNYKVPIRLLRHPELNDSKLVEEMARLKPQHWETLKDHPQFQAGCLANFSAARRLSFEACQNEVAGWIDSDDVLEEPEKGRQLVEDFFGNPTRNCLFFRYDYSHDSSDGLCTTTLMRERFVRRKQFRWVGACHETLLPEGVGVVPAICGNPAIFVRHVLEHRKEHRFSDIRNYAIMRREIDAVGGNVDRVDPRTLYYIGNSCRGLGDKLEAIQWYLAFLPRSGSRDDRVLALLHIGELFRSLGRQWRAIRYFQEAELVGPEDPRPLIGISQCYCDLGNWRQAIEYAERGLMKSENFQTLSSYDPQSLRFFPWFFIATAAREMGDLPRAVQAAQKIMQARPGHQIAKDFVGLIDQWANRVQLAQAVHATVSRAVSLPTKVRVLQDLNLPYLEDLGLGKPEYDINRKGRATVALFCGGTFEPWGPKGPAGIGGSERMVIEMAKRLQARNLAVTVYCNLPPEQKGIHDDVLWRHYLEFNPTIARDFLVLWRNVDVLSMSVPAKRRYVWLHDITGNEVWSPVNVALCDKTIFLSPWHRSLCPSLPDNKAYISRNGIDVELIREVERRGLVRDPYHVVYASSPDRGLYTALSIWGDLMQAGKLPKEARMSVLYGFNQTFFKMAASPAGEYMCVDGVQRHRLDYQEMICTMLDQLPNVQLLGRVPSDKVIETFLTAGAMFYPTQFSETFCIVAAEAQACGCLPLTTDLAALQTTNKYGQRFQLEEAPNALLQYFAGAKELETRRSEMAEKARKDFDLEALANDWYLRLFGEI